MSLPNTHHGHDEIAAIIEGKKKLFFDGIGGVSMNSLAHISKLRGYEVSGYDRSETDITRKLTEMGITVYSTSSAEHVKDCAALIYTVAMPETNEEYAYAKENGIPLISRADYLGYIMTGYNERIGVSGTHGKSTTTGMLAKIFTSAGKNPTVSGGAALKETGDVDIIGGHDCFIFEACEYMDSFLDFSPTVAVVLNIELDHVDYFKSMEQMRASYTSFMSLPHCRAAVINSDDENCRIASDNYKGELITFSRIRCDADFYSENEEDGDGYPEFDICSGGERLAHIKLSIPGEHNISNSLAAFAAAYTAGLRPAEIERGLCSFTGIKRRMEKVCVTDSGAAVYTDYAHHPTEIAATLTSARKITKGRLSVIFQPHTFSRTAELFESFVSALSGSGADRIILCPIYSARETNTYGVSSDMLAEKIRESGMDCGSMSIEDAARAVLSESGEGDGIVVMGAGDVNCAAELIKNGKL